MAERLEALQAETERERTRAEAEAEAERQRQREAQRQVESAERSRREAQAAQAESDRRQRIGNHVCVLTKIAHWRDRVPVAVEDSAKARVHEAMANAPAGASDAELRAIAERAAKDVYQHSLQENAATQIAAATPAITSLPALPSQETSLVAHGDESVDGDGDDDEAPGGGPTLEPEEGQDGGGPGLGGLLLVGSLLAAGALLVKGVTDTWGIRVMDPTGQSPAWIRTPPPPSVAPAGYHFEMMRTGETVLVRDGYTLT